MQPKVSVIVPVYNVKSEYLDISVGSIISQTYKNLEIILVDDGSEKTYSDYCDKLATTDNRIKVIHKKNQGVSKARNIGTVNATGDYITYVDADDILACYAVEHGVSELQKHDADMVIGASQKVFDSVQFQPANDKTSYLVDTLHSDRFDELRQVYLNDATSEYRSIGKEGYIERGPSCRIIKCNIAKKNQFPENLSIGEDVVWNMRLLHDCRKVCVIKEIWYGYVMYQSSAIRKYYGNREELANKYIQQLFYENSDYCVKNMRSYGKNIAVEFYCILRYEMMSEKCMMTESEKKENVRAYLTKDPWNILMRREVKLYLPFMYRILFSLCSSGLWTTALRLYKCIKR